MAKFTFRLQGYLNVKYKLEDQRKQAYGLAVANVEREKQKKIDILDEKASQISQFKDSIKITINPRNFSDYNNYIQFLKNRIIAQEKIILEAQKEAEKKRLELVEAMKERKMLEKLRERQHDEYLREERLAETRAVDELVTSMTARNRGGIHG